jgi:ABC-2 type transport system ATP-binding protein
VVLEQHRRGRAVLLVSHMLTEVEKLCDRVAVVVGGRIFHLGPLPELTKDRPLKTALQALYAKAT